LGLGGGFSFDNGHIADTTVPTQSGIWISVAAKVFHFGKYGKNPRLTIS